MVLGVTGTSFPTMYLHLTNCMYAIAYTYSSIHDCSHRNSEAKKGFVFSGLYLWFPDCAWLTCHIGLENTLYRSLLLFTRFTLKQGRVPGQ